MLKSPMQAESMLAAGCAERHADGARSNSGTAFAHCLAKFGNLIPAPSGQIRESNSTSVVHQRWNGIPVRMWHEGGGRFH
jgi:hypothetical protein